MNYFERIKSYEDACQDQAIEPMREPDVSMLPTGLAKYIRAAYRLAIIAVSLNKDEDGKERKANWNNISEWKYFAWMNVLANKKNPSGSGLSFLDTDCVYSGTCVASRLTLREQRIVKYFFTQFKDLWEDFILHRD